MIIVIITVSVIMAIISKIIKCDSILLHMTSKSPAARPLSIVGTGIGTPTARRASRGYFDNLGRFSDQLDQLSVPNVRITLSFLRFMHLNAITSLLFDDQVSRTSWILISLENPLAKFFSTRILRSTPDQMLESHSALRMGFFPFLTWQGVMSHPKLR